MNKIERDGKVAVLYSPGFGAGWSTWADDEHRDYLCMDAELVQAVLDGNNDRAAAIARAKIEHLYTGGARDLTVEWIPKGTAFEISEYDGSESVRLMSNRQFQTT